MKTSYIDALMAAALIAEPENEREYRMQIEISKLLRSKNGRGLLCAANSYIEYFGDWGEDVPSIYKTIKRI